MDTPWWSGQPHENLFMEITRRADRVDYGESLNAPLSARGGAETAGYELVRLVGPGSIVVHYDSGSGHVTGVSQATGEALQRPIWWAARGTYARKARVQPDWHPGFSVVLDSYQPLDAPLSIGTIRQRRDAILALRARLEAQYPGRSLYFPWNRYASTLRTYQSYLAKFPRAALEILPEVASAVDRLR